MKPSAGRAAVWATAVSASAVVPHAAPVALGVAVAKEVFDLVHARLHRISVLSYMRAAGARTYLSIDPSETAPGVVLCTAPASAGPSGDEEGARLVPADDERSLVSRDIDPGDFCVKHRPDWLGYAVSLTRSFPDAEDAVSHAVEKVLAHHKKNGTLCPAEYEDPVAYAKTMTANYVIDRHRRWKVQEKWLPTLVPSQDDFTDDVLDKVIAGMARAFIATLKPQAHVIAMMRWAEGLEPKQIADRLELNVITVRTSLYRTRRKMRTHLGIAAEPQRILTEETT
jgi:RNA polymerase sigma factor (sigma-70 family)